MKPYKWIVNGALLVFSAFGLSACDMTRMADPSPYKNIILEEAAHLTKDASSPYCDLSIDYSFLTEEGDSIAKLINRKAQGEFLGEAYASLHPEVAIDSFKNVYLREYRKEVEPLYLADRAKAAPEDETPAWYNQTYSLLTFWDEGHGGALHVSATYFVDMGGAHPNQWSRWLNFDFESGKLLTKEDVFQASAQSDIEQLLLEKLICLQAEQHPEEKVASLEDLQHLGFLQMTPMYIPENFLLGKDALMFLFNRYDIAPYSAGEIVIEIPYEEIGPYLKL